ncbi:hypothetical protein [Levilactobacillus bambusae]|uniref:Accessory Sec system glycosyltransferase GtfB n=1 Tax=Levilactobacillus bambusae TaxID=2024736 RepID=A0A2V1MY55_9LACO|nr:hypothetical protein [Levilactobacillus bambusae]PWF99918.1 hypothetical protein DCM90_02905 [Levilactobacillus bambusae]
MNYEVLNVLHPDTTDWTAQKARLQRINGTLLTLAPDPGLLQKQIQEQINVVNVVDYVTNRTYNPDQFLFFDQIPTVAGAEIFMAKSGQINLIHDGYPIGTVRLYPNTRRLVNNITYLNLDGTRDFIEEYAFDGKLFSRIDYDDNHVQRIQFYNDDQVVVLTYYFYNGQMNLITVEDPASHRILERYDSTGAFLAAKVGEIIQADDAAVISYLGLELTALSQTQSDNTLALIESPLDEQGEVRGNLKAILDNRLPYVQHVALPQKLADQLLKAHQPMTKILIETEGENGRS